MLRNMDLDCRKERGRCRVGIGLKRMEGDEMKGGWLNSFNPEIISLTVFGRCNDIESRKSLYLEQYLYLKSSENSYPWGII
jgi:hypothetical protein